MKKVNVQKELNNLLGTFMLIEMLADDAVEQTQKLIKSLPKEGKESFYTNPRKETGLDESIEIPSEEEIEKAFSEVAQAFKKFLANPLFGGKKCRQ